MTDAEITIRVGELKTESVKLKKEGSLILEFFMVNASNRPESQLPQCGCETDANIAAARNFLKAIAAGVSAHSDHGRNTVETFRAAVAGQKPEHKINDVLKLYKLAEDFGIPTKDRQVNDVARQVGETALGQFDKSEGYQLMAQRAPQSRQKIWEKLEIIPHAVDREIVEALHQANAGADKDYKKIIMHAARTALADGWGCSMLAAELQDTLFGTPYPRTASVHIGANANEEVNISQDAKNAVVGFSSESISYILGGKYRSSYRLLNDNIINGRIRGIAGILGCTEAESSQNTATVILAKKLIKRNVLVLTTGDAATACCDAGLADPRQTAELAGAGLAEVCEAVGIPPMLHCGSCIDNCRLLTVFTQLISEGGLGEDISEIPAAATCLESVTEKVISIGQYFVASGLLMVCVSELLPVFGSKNVSDYLLGGIEKDLGGRWAIESDPVKAAELILAHIEKKRNALGINKHTDRKLYDMADRRVLTVE